MSSLSLLRRSALLGGALSLTAAAQAQVGLENININGLAPKSVSISAASVGELGVAIGSEAQAVGSIAIGHGAFAPAFQAIAIGTVSEDGYGPVDATGDQSVAIGAWAEASDHAALALGEWAHASGRHSVATVLASALAISSVAIGQNSFAYARESITLGRSAEAHARGSISIGAFNRSGLRRDGEPIDPLVAHPQDPLLILGRGTSVNDRDNALVIYRDGRANFTGPIQVQFHTLQPIYSGTSRTLFLPDLDGTLLTDASRIDASRIVGTLPAEALPAGIASLPVASETVDGVSVISSPLRIKPQGDLPMLGE